MLSPLSDSPFLLPPFPLPIDRPSSQSPLNPKRIGCQRAGYEIPSGIATTSGCRIACSGCSALSPALRRQGGSLLACQVSLAALHQIIEQVTALLSAGARSPLM